VLEELQRGHGSGACSAAPCCCPCPARPRGDDVADVDLCSCCADEREEVDDDDVGDGLETTGCRSMGRDVVFPSFTLFSWSMAAPLRSSWIMVTDGKTSSAAAQKASRRWQRWCGVVAFRG
jgi:hypothetical protein